MNQNKQLTTSNFEGNKTAVPVLMFEAANHTVPVRLTSNFTTQDQLCDDKDLVKVPTTRTVHLLVAFERFLNPLPDAANRVGNRLTFP